MPLPLCQTDYKMCRETAMICVVKRLCGSMCCFRPDVWFGLRVLKAVQLMEVPLLKSWIHHQCCCGSWKTWHLLQSSCWSKQRCGAQEGEWCDIFYLIVRNGLMTFLSSSLLFLLYKLARATHFSHARTADIMMLLDQGVSNGHSI